MEFFKYLLRHVYPKDRDNVYSIPRFGEADKNEHRGFDSKRTRKIAERGTRGVSAQGIGGCNEMLRGGGINP